MYIAKIPGTKYICSLESDQGQWLLRLKLGDVVEAEEPVEQMTKKGLHNHLGDLFKQVNIQINNFQHDLIHKEITSQVTHMLGKEQDTPSLDEDDGDTENTGRDPRVDDLMKKLEALENSVEEMEDRLARVESLS